MYLDFFGLEELPFGITPDTSYAFFAQSHQEALNTLLVALDSGEGFIKITGEVGTGKTLLCRRLLQSLDEDVLSAYLPNPYLGPETLMCALAEELDIDIAAGADEYHVLQAIHQALLDAAEDQCRVVVLIDEAQAMPLETLETLRLLSNLETEKRKLLQIVLFGQPELDEKLAQHSVRQLRQRIAFHYHLRGLTRLETGSYLAHRLRVAGYRGHEVFASPAVRALHRGSAGTPRLLNILAHKALLAAFGEGRREVTFTHVKRAVADTPGARFVGWW